MQNFRVVLSIDIQYMNQISESDLKEQLQKDFDSMIEAEELCILSNHYSQFRGCDVNIKVVDVEEYPQ